MERYCPVVENEKISAIEQPGGDYFLIELIPALADDGSKSKPTIKEVEIAGIDESVDSSQGFYYNSVYVNQGELAMLHDDSAGNSVARMNNNGDLEIATEEDDANKYSKQNLDLVYGEE